MKKIILLLNIFIVQIFFAQNVIKPSSVNTDINTDFTFDIDFENTDAVAAFQFDIIYDSDAIDLSTGSSLSSRASSHSLNIRNIDDNTIRVIGFSNNNTSITSGIGKILTLNLKSKNEPDTYIIQITNITLSDSESNSLSSSSTSGQITINGPRYNLETTSISFGDVPMQSTSLKNVTISNTGNTVLEISGYTLESPFLINTTFPISILPGQNTSIPIEVNTSSKQNISKSIIFNTNDTDPLRALQQTTIIANIYAVNEIHIGSNSGAINTSISIPVSINNMEPFNGFQLDINIPSGIIYEANSIALVGRETDHNIIASMINSNTLRVIAYSETKTNFTGNSGDIFLFKLTPSVNSGTYSISTSGEIISNTEQENIISNSYEGSLTINAPLLFISNSDSNINLGRIPINSNQLSEITLKNSGNSDLIIDEIIYNSNTITSDITTPLTITPNQSLEKNIAFTPINTGSFSSSIYIRHNAADVQNIVNITADVFSPNYLVFEETTFLINENNNVKLNISNYEDIKGIQFDLNIPEGFVFNTDNINKSNVLDNFEITSYDLGDRNYRFLIYTLSNQIIPANSNNILTLPFFVENTTALGDYTFTISSVTLSNTNNQNVASEMLEIGVIHLTDKLTWTGLTNTNWNDTSNWNTSAVIPVTANVLIPNGISNYPVISSTTDVYLSSLILENNASLIIEKGASLTLSNDFINSGLITLQSDSDEFSSLLVSGTSSGNITYNRYVNTVGIGEWDLIGAPVSGMAFSNIITDNNIATNGSFYAIGSYDNATDTWTNATNSTTGNLALGQGYQMATTSGGTLSFTGAIASGDQSVTIVNNNAANSGAGRRWNLIANPFPSYLNGNSNADPTDNFLTINTAAIDDNFEAIYGWKADGTGYAIYNNTSSPTYIAPGQGFFIAAVGSGEDKTISFTKAMQTVTGTDDFVAAKSATSYELVLELYSDGVKEDDTKFYFKEGLTLSLDPGYDAGAFNQTTGISSRLIEQDNGVSMDINAMPTNALSNAIVPLTINQEAGIALKIQIATSTIPEDINVYLEDTVANTFTLLINESFELTAKTILSGMGRFFIHFTTSTLSTDIGNSSSLVTAYKGTGNTYITVEGLQQLSQPAEFMLYSVLGVKVVSQKIQKPTQKETLSTVGLKKGAYILKVQTENGVYTKKILVD